LIFIESKLSVIQHNNRGGLNWKKTLRKTTSC
jgi:hypothetical protein